FDVSDEIGRGRRGSGNGCYDNTGSGNRVAVLIARGMTDRKKDGHDEEQRQSAHGFLLLSVRSTDRSGVIESMTHKAKGAFSGCHESPGALNPVASNMNRD